MRRPRLPDDEGAVAVEAAIILPVLCLLVFGIIEFGMLFRANLSFSQAARSGARTAVALPRTPYADPSQQAVAGSLRTTINTNEIKFLTIYKANPTTGLPADGSTYKTCSSSCYRYTWDAGTRTWTLVSGTAWAPSSQKACGTIDHTDYLGIYVEGEYRWKTGIFNPIFGSSTTIAERTVMRLEPVKPPCE